MSDINERLTQPSRHERRESPRAFFTFEDNISAFIAKSDSSSKTFPVTLLSISAGGLSFICHRKKTPKLKIGQRVEITDIHTPPPLDPIKMIQGSVRYLMDCEGDIRLIVGCEFVDVSPHFREKIQEFVKIYFDKMGFYL